MKKDRWQEIERILDEALARPLPGRSAYLDEACLGDAELRAEVEALLEADGSAPGFLDQDAAAFVAPVWESPGTPASPVTPGQRLGPYRLDRLIGQGGMSVVYLAERDDDQFRRQVAVKLLGQLGEDRVRRFHAERQILASLNHPHIAQVYDSGVTETGWPYLVMEYVQGDPITDYCNARLLSIDRRLELFADVCRAVQHAHQHLVIHRDLKPSNIYVTDEGRVKLLDFGIAKIVADPETGDSEIGLTRTGMRLMTPEYAAPEQFKGGAVTTATDVYALGVVLYELLTDLRPFRLDAKTPGEMERVICEQKPTRPSTAVTRDTDPDRAEEVGRARAVSIAHLPQLLRGDLDTIILKALRKDPEERYGSVSALAEDLRRHRQGLPVEAREPTLGYRARKFLGRHRLGAMGAAAFVLLLLVSVAALVVSQARTAQEAATAREVSDFVMGLFHANDPSLALGDAVTALDLLDRGVEQVESLEAQPLVQAEMLAVMGSAYQSLGSYDRAEPLLRQALSIRRQHLGDDRLEVAESRWALGELLRERAEWPGAAEQHRQALELRRRLAGEISPEVAASLHSLGMVLSDQANYDEAEAGPSASLEMWRTLRGAEDPEYAVTLGDMAALRHAQGDYDEAEELFQEALLLQRRLRGDKHPAVQVILMNLAWNTYRMGNLTASEELHRQVLALRRQVFGSEHPQTAATVNNLAIVVEKQGRLEEAAELHREVLAIRLRLYGEEHAQVARSMNNLAVCLHRQRLYDEAEPLYRDVVRIKQATMGPEHPSVAATLNNLGVLLEKKGDLEAAQQVHEQALAIRIAALGEGHPVVAETLNNLAVALMRRGRLEEAETRLRRALEIRQAELGPEHYNVGRTLGRLGDLLVEQGRSEEAEKAFLASLRNLRVALEDEHRFTQAALNRLPSFYEDWGKPERAAHYAAQLDPPAGP